MFGNNYKYIYGSHQQPSCFRSVYIFIIEGAQPCELHFEAASNLFNL